MKESEPYVYDFLCSRCGGSITEEHEVCPHCGCDTTEIIDHPNSSTAAPNKNPFGLYVAVAVGAVLCIAISKAIGLRGGLVGGVAALIGALLGSGIYKLLARAD